ncbi:MAG TPA: hypothetical protein VGR40_05250 [Candidatus Binatus sp.]|nr:hypothetical protein [Candidatus Binatus sp.]
MTAPRLPATLALNLSSFASPERGRSRCCPASEKEKIKAIPKDPLVIIASGFFFGRKKD